MASFSDMLFDEYEPTLDELLDDGDHCHRVLVFGALVRVFTLGQIARLTGRDIGATDALLNELQYAKGWVDGLDNLQLPKYCGGGLVSVYYLTVSGAAALKRAAAAVYKLARPGKPQGKMRANLPAELLVAEAVLWLRERYQIFEFLAESGPSDEAAGDFKVCFDDGYRMHTVVCQIAIRYTYDQIAAKPDGMLWFTRDERQADLIEAIKGSRPLILGDVAAPQSSSTVPRVFGTSKGTTARKRKRRTFRDRILASVDRLGGCTTVKAVSNLLWISRGNVCKTMNHLVAAGKLGRTVAHLRPGQDRGRPATLYFRAEAPPTTIHEKVRALIIARAVMLIVWDGKGPKKVSRESDYRLHEYDRTSRQIEFRPRLDYTQPAFIFVVDDQFQAVDHTYTRLRAAEARAFGRNAIVAALVASPTRIAQLRALCKEKSPKSRIIDIWQLGRPKQPSDGTAQ